MRSLITILVGTTGFEPASLLNPNQTRYQVTLRPDNGALDKIRTHDPHIRSVVLYPTELLAHYSRILYSLLEQLQSIDFGGS